MLVKYAKRQASKKNTSERVMWDRVIRSGTKVGASYIDAVASLTDRDTQKSLAASFKSCNESRYWLKLIRDTGVDGSKQLNDLLNESRVLSRMIGKKVAMVRK